jgi:periplasmic copper chaperone A
MVRRVVAASVLAIGLVCAGAIPAWAHVTVAPEEAVKGASDVEIAFRVPNEETKASTNKVEIVIPSDPPLLGVLAQPVAGWTTTVVTTHLAKALHTDDGDISDVVTDVTWTASNADSAIKPDNYQRFSIIAGALPDADQIVFKAVQTYSDGTVVRWVDPVTAGGPAAERPTPILRLTAPTGSATATTTPTTAATGTASGTIETVKNDADTAKTIGIIAIIFAVIALAGMAFSLVRKRASSA